jgi:hypothetical protein
MSSHRFRFGIAASFVIGLLGCDATGPAGAPRIILGGPSSVAPGGHLAVFVTATPPSGDAIDRVRLEVSGATTFVDSVSGAGAGNVVMRRSIEIPDDIIAGEVIVNATAWIGSTAVRDTMRVAVADTAPPRIESFLVQPAQGLNPGDVVTVSFTANDDAGLRATMIRVSGAATLTDSMAHGLARNVFRSAKIVVPLDVRLGAELAISAEAIDAGGGRTVVSAVPQVVRDTRNPSITGTIGGSRVGTRFAPGDTLRLILRASDNHFLERVGYTIGSPAVVADTFDITGTNAFERVLEFIVQQSWIGTHAITGWARDASGNLSTATLATITVLPSAPPADSVQLGAPVRDLAYDAGRNIVYVSQPSLNRVGAVTLGDMVFDAVLEGLPLPQGIDLTPSGDTLLIAPRLTRSLYIYDVVRRTRDSVLITNDTFLNRGLDNVRVMANGSALISVTFSGSGFGGTLASLDLASRVVRSRATVTEATPIARSMSRRRAAILIDDSCCPLSGHVYDAGSDQLSAARGTVSYYFPGISADSTGQRYLIGSTLFTGDLVSIRSYTIPGGTPGHANALSPDGAHGYFATDNGVTMLRLSDGALETTFPLPGRPLKLLALPNGRALLAVVGQTLHVIWLQ